ncbi:MAG TPA: exodeoxyribonuclease VII large subunit [Longimicrobiales bacterium]
MRRDPFFAEARAPAVPVAGDPVGRGGMASHAATGQAYTVSAVNALVRELLEGAFPPLWVAGEVSGWKRHTSGHCYFGLRDATAQLRCVMFRSDAQRLPTDPDEGMEVRVLGTLTLYERRGDYQLVVRELEAEGAGGLWRLAFERLRARLEAEGLLAPERKRSLPRCPATVAVVTSPVGAALHDILHVIERRAPWTRVIVSPAKVQGDGAAEDVARAIERVARAGVADVVIVARGGGSVEDLWAFNEEVVARAIAACPIPVISGVGHEVDVTIADLVADARAPTPSAAAEMAVPDGQALARHLEDLGGRLPGGLRQLLAERRGELMLLRTGLGRAVRDAVRRRRERLLQAAAKLDALSPLAALRRGYAVPLGDDGRVLRRAAEFVRGGQFRLRVVDGNVRCRVDEVSEVRDAEGSDG